MRVFLIGLTVLVMAAGLLVAENLGVKYLEGSCEVQKGSAWQRINFGEKIDATAMVRLAKQSLLVLQTAESTISISKAGTYKLSDVLGNSKQTADTNLGSIIGRKLQTVANSGKTTATAGGVKADPQSEKKPNPWQGGDASITRHVQEAETALVAGDLKKARTSFDRAMYESLPAERTELVLTIGMLCADAGYASLALSYVSGHEADSKQAAYQDYTMMKARVLFESMSYEDAALYAETSLKSVKDTRPRQALLIVQGLSERALGQSSKSQSTLDGAVKLDPASDEGKIAAKFKAG